MAWTTAARTRTSLFETYIKRVPAGLSHWPLFLVVLLLSLFGLLMVYSASAALGGQNFGDAMYFVKRQATFLAGGWMLYFIIAELPVLRLCQHRFALYIAALGLLSLVLIPGIGVSAGGAQRWIGLGPLQFQAAELTRLLLVFYLAGMLAYRSDRLDSFNRGFFPLLVVTSSLMFLMILQPDFGGAVGLFILSVSLWFIGRVPIAYLTGLFILAIPALAFVMTQATYRAQRLMAFLNPWEDAQGGGFQVIQSYMAFYEGGWTGLGLGNSHQKLFYLPEAHTDFVFSVIGEETGVVGSLIVISLFVALLVMGSRITKAQVTMVGYYLAAGITIFLSIPALMNLMITVGMLPTKGLPLPFFSYGGSSLLVCMMAAGVLQSLYYRRNENAP